MTDLNQHRDKIDALIEFLQPFITEKRFERISEVAAQRTEYVTVILENLFQGHNASAVLRTCDCFGVLNIHAVESVNIFSPNEEIALGAEKWLNINNYTQDNAIIELYSHLHNKGYAIAATTPHGNPISVDDIPVDKPIALVFGTEKDGLSAEALNRADFTVALPMYGFTESFNISVSAALFLQKVTDKMIAQKVNRALPIEEQKYLIANWMLKTVSDPDGLMRKFLIGRE
jgi:tRNA (guanosine-2'-O-)-methyltransferase